MRNFIADDGSTSLVVLNTIRFSMKLGLKTEYFSIDFYGSNI
jgi:hypothetical protein